MNWLFLIILLVVVAVCYFYILQIPSKTEGEWEPRYWGGAKEIEARFLDIDADKLREAIKKNGGKKVHDERKLRRNVYRLKDRKGFARVRDEGDVTMTVKIYPDGEGTKFPEEYEIVTTSSFDDASEFMGAMLDKKSYHETYREKWGMPGVNEVVIDKVPGLAPYCEIEADDEGALKKACKKLGLNWDEAHYGAYGKTFEEEYDVPVKWFNDELDELTFETVGEKVGPMVKKNKEKFEAAVALGTP
jgi:adenylate cyclase class IV